jgi:hypothetical protein
MTLAHFKIVDEKIAYTGRELRGGWVSETTGLSGDAAVAFFGPCRVATNDLVDLDDAKNGATIEAAEMAHVIVEHPNCTLQVAVLRQRLLVCILCEVLGQNGIAARRDGDDVYVEDRKLTVSIAAPSRSSCLIHLGVNIDPAGAPVAAVGLDELGVPAVDVVKGLLNRYQDELESAAYAETKVRSVD